MYLWCGGVGVSQRRVSHGSNKTQGPGAGDIQHGSVPRVHLCLRRYFRAALPGNFSHPKIPFISPSSLPERGCAHIYAAHSLHAASLCVREELLASPASSAGLLRRPRDLLCPPDPGLSVGPLSYMSRRCALLGSFKARLSDVSADPARRPAPGVETRSPNESPPGFLIHAGSPGVMRAGSIVLVGLTRLCPHTRTHTHARRRGQRGNRGNVKP